MKKKTKINWKNILLAIVGVIEGVSFINTWYVLTIGSWITGRLATLTAYGTVSTIIELVIVSSIGLYFAEELEKGSDNMKRLEKELKEKKYFKVAMFYEVKDWLENNGENLKVNEIWEIVDKMDSDQQLSEEISDCIENYFEEMEGE